MSRDSYPRNPRFNCLVIASTISAAIADSPEKFKTTWTCWIKPAKINPFLHMSNLETLPP